MSLVDKAALLIDDDPELRKLVEKILVNVGMSVYHAGNVKDAFEIIKNKCPHVIITDLNMQPESGYDFLEKFKSDPTISNTPTIVLSSRTGREAIYKAMSLGAKEYLTKPIEAKLILQKVRKLVRSSEFSSLEFPRGLLPTITMKIPGTLLGGNEQGLQIETPVRLSRESSVMIEIAEIAAMGFDRPPTLRSSKQLAKANEQSVFVNELRFLGLIEKQIAALKDIIKRWHTK